MDRPQQDEYAPFYHTYVGAVPEGDVLQILAEQVRQTVDLLSGLTEEQALFRYAPGKWSVKEVVGHMADTERVMSYRALCIGRGDETPLPAFDEDAYVRDAGFDARSLEDLVQEFQSVRMATIPLLRGLDDAASRRRGTASGKPITARALAFVIAGHELHHRNLLRERYGLS